MICLGLIIDCDTKSVTLFHEFKVYTAKTNEANCMFRGFWVTFTLNENGEAIKVSPYNGKRWNSRVSTEGDILLDVNAQVRDLNEFPPPPSMPLVNVQDYDLDQLLSTPWSYELDWLEDVENKMSTTRKGRFYEVSVKFVYSKDGDGKDTFRFPILDVLKESSTEIQLKTPCTPWVKEMMSRKEEEPAPIRVNGKLHRNDRTIRDPNWMYGIITRQKNPGNITYVWSLDGGEQRVVNRKVTQLKPGDFVRFKISSKFTKVEKAHSIKESGFFNKSADERIVKVLVNFPMPQLNHMQKKYVMNDNFLGQIDIDPSLIGRLLTKHGKILLNAHGKTIKLWVAPRNEEPQERAFRESFWEPHAIHDDIYTTPQTDLLTSSSVDLLM